MARKINANTLGSVGLLGETPKQAPEKPGVSPDETKRLALEGIEALIDEVNGLAAPVKREKVAKDELKKAMQDIGLTDFTTKSGGNAKIVEKNSDSVNEEAIVAWAKANGRADLVKTYTVEQLDMEALERAIYAEEGLADEDKLLTKVLANNTTTNTSYALRVTAPKAKKGE